MSAEGSAAVPESALDALRQARTRLADDAPGRRWCRDWTDAVDDCVRALGASTVRPHGVAVAALGGHGRRELCPASDVDLLVVHDRASDDELSAVVRSVVTPLWDAGLKVGHAVRDVREVLDSVDDVESATALLDVRVLLGDRDLGQRVRTETLRRILRRPDVFLDALHAADLARRARAGDAAEVLEPDLKNGAGGLRDVQSLRWAAAALVGTASLDALVAAGHLGAADRTRLARAARVVLNVRIALHQVTGTRPGLATTDLLHLGVHGRVARRLGFEDADAPAAVVDLDPGGPRALHPARGTRSRGRAADGSDGSTSPAVAPGSPVDLAEHRLLREVYLATRTIDHVHRRAWRLIDADRRDGRRRTRPTQRTVDVFELHDGVLRIPDDVDLATPELATRLFAALVDTGAVLDRATAHRLRVHTAEGHRWRWTSRDRESFVATLWRGRLMLPALAELDDTGMLVALLPGWEVVRGRAQRNPYHRYALDRHAWHAVAELGELVRRHRWAAEALEQVEDREGLLLGVLFHDVGKALGEPHEVSGVRLARTMARRMGAPTATVEFVGRLTRLHLLLGVARTRDVTDRALAEQLADVVGDHPTLAALHLLTAADGLATGPRVYNDWTAGLTAALVTRVSAVLDSIDPDQIADDAVATARAAQEMAEELGATEDAVREHLALLPSRYAALLSPRAVVRHTLMAQTRPGPGEVRTRVTPTDQDPEGVEGLDVLDVVALDHPGWFAKVAGVIALHGGEIVAADAFGRDDGLAVDTFRVRPPEGAAGSWWARVEGDLVDAGAGRLAVRARVGRMADQQAHRVARFTDVPTSVTAEPDSSGRATVVEVRTLDRVGVLYAIASALAELEVDIVVARISTVGHEANDAFTCRNAEGGPLDDDHVREVQMAITAAIDDLSSPAA